MGDDHGRPQERRDEGAALAARDKALRQANAIRSPEERLAVMAVLQREAFELLTASPRGLQHFMQRNCRDRQARVTDGEWTPVSPARRAAGTCG